MDLRAQLLAASALASLLLPFSLTAQETPAARSDNAAPAQRGDAAAPRQRATGTAAPAAAEGELPIPPETTSVTHHEWTAGSRPVHYTATAGNILIKGEGQDAKPICSMFYTCLHRGRRGPENPALSPSSTTVAPVQPPSGCTWSFRVGPVRVITKGPKPGGAPPYEVVPNQYSLLDKTDLVFIDAPMTGYSRLVGKGKAADIAGVDPDIRAFNAFITRYLNLNQRWASPKYLFGESYGTPRSAALVASLNNDGIAFNGVVLLSSVLNYFVNSPGYDLDTKRYIPSYAAIAWYHNKVPHNGTMQDFVQKAREFDRTEYATALDQGDMLPPAEFDAIAAKLAGFTGLSVDYIKGSQAPHRSPHAFPQGTPSAATPRSSAATMLASKATTWTTSARTLAMTLPTPASPARMSPRFTTTCRMSSSTTPTPSTISTPLASTGTCIIAPLERRWVVAAVVVQALDPAAPDTVIDLSDAMRKNPELRVFSANGWYDLATPFFGTEHDLGQLMLPPSQLGNVQFGYYPAGHMVYLNVDALKDMHADLEKWYGKCRTATVLQAVCAPTVESPPRRQNRPAPAHRASSGAFYFRLTPPRSSAAPAACPTLQRSPPGTRASPPAAPPPARTPSPSRAARTELAPHPPACADASLRPAASAASPQPVA